FACVVFLATSVHVFCPLHIRASDSSFKQRAGVSSLFPYTTLFRSIQHATNGTEYEVRARMDEARCVVEVIDGGGVNGAAVMGVEAEWGNEEAAPLAEHGRGLQLMRAFTEELRIADRVQREGAIVHFEKSLAG